MAAFSVELPSKTAISFSTDSLILSCLASTLAWFSGEGATEADLLTAIISVTVSPTPLLESRIFCCWVSSPVVAAAAMAACEKGTKFSVRLVIAGPNFEESSMLA
eukprot:Lithocolla_globosa_v1_NODE_805_length_3253_cov_31.566604.p6 type:complete len:105 gc:universal NODE_805_length_3253_cov_31.566604:1151-837(-)